MDAPPCHTSRPGMERPATLMEIAIPEIAISQLPSARDNEYLR